MRARCAHTLARARMRTGMMRTARGVGTRAVPLGRWEPRTSFGRGKPTFGSLARRVRRRCPEVGLGFPGSDVSVSWWVLLWSSSSSTSSSSYRRCGHMSSLASRRLALLAPLALNRSGHLRVRARNCMMAGKEWHWCRARVRTRTSVRPHAHARTHADAREHDAGLTLSRQQLRVATLLRDAVIHEVATRTTAVAAVTTTTTTRRV